MIGIAPVERDTKEPHPNKIRNASNAVTASAYLQHVVPSAPFDDINVLVDELSDENAPPLTGSDQSVLDAMLSNRDKRMQRYAEQGRATALPPDSPIVKKWTTGGFLSNDESLPRTETIPMADETAKGEATYFLERLESDDARARVRALYAISGRPLPDERVLAACEKLLDDRTITVLGIPYSFGEVCWVAADAVAAVRGLLGRSGDVVIDDVFAPIPSGRVGQLAREVGVAESTKGGIEGEMETLERIAAAGLLPRRRVRRAPRVDGAKT